MTDRPSDRSGGRSANARDVAGKPTVSAGEVLGGRFRVERIVGRGGMGVVVEATNQQLGQKVAVKLLLGGADDPATAERVIAEARAAARLKSEHVARVYDVGLDATHGPFIVMEMLEGNTLSDVLSTSGQVPLHRAVEYVIDACEGLAEAHARGIVHQDVKPANLFLVTGSDGRPTVKVLDFGIATMRTRASATDSKSNHPAAGTPAYLAPEQLRGSGSVDHRADVWALGCVLYELLVGQRAFRAPRFTELVTAILESPPNPFPDETETTETTHKSKVPSAVQEITRRCLEKDPERRYASTGELALALLPFARRRSHTAVSRAVSHVKSAGLDPALQMPSSMPPRPPEGGAGAVSGVGLIAPKVPVIDPPSGVSVPPRRIRPALLAAAALLVLALAGALAWTSTKPRPEPAPTPSASVTSSGSPSMSSSPSLPSASPSATVPPTRASSEEVPPPSASTPARAQPVFPRPAHPAASASGSPAPTSPDSEIRHTR